MIIFNPGTGRTFFITRTGTTPLAFRKGRSQSFAEKTSVCASTSTPRWWSSYDPRSIFDLVMAGQSQIFAKSALFQLCKPIFKKLSKHSDMKSSTTCSPCNSASDEVFFKPLSLILLAQNAKKSRTVTMMTSLVKSVTSQFGVITCACQWGISIDRVHSHIIIAFESTTQKKTKSTNYVIWGTSEINRGQ